MYAQQKASCFWVSLNSTMAAVLATLCRAVHKLDEVGRVAKIRLDRQPVAQARIFPLAIAAYAAVAHADDELTLFNARGAADAYIAVDDGLTIYLWSGKPVTYLEKLASTKATTSTGSTGSTLAGSQMGQSMPTMGPRHAPPLRS
jgi:hypothetical protein